MNNFQHLSMIGLCTFLFLVAAAVGQQFTDWSDSDPVNLGPVVNSSAGDFFAAISKDGLSLYLTSSRPHGDLAQTDSEIYVSKRRYVTDPWGAPQSLGPTINTPYNEGAPSLSVDGHRMYFGSNRPNPHGANNNDIYVSRRRKKDVDIGPDGWETPQNIGHSVNTSANETSPAIFEDDATGAKTLYFDSNRQGGLGPFTNDGANNGNDIWASVLHPDGTFEDAQFVPLLNTVFADRQPSIRRNGLEIFFASDRPGGLGLLDLWVSTRATTSDGWGAPVNLGSPVNSTTLDAGPELSFDAETLYFQSTRSGTLGAFDLYVTTRTKLKGKKE